MRPPRQKDRVMKDVGNLARNRTNYLRTRFPNLTFLFEKRFSWMNKYIGDTDEVLEVGCGIGITKLFLKKGHITLSDIEDNPWLDRREDAVSLTYKDNSLDVIIANNMIHHLCQPIKFFGEASRVLKKGGRVLIQDVNCSWCMCGLLRMMRIEDFDFSVDAFDVHRHCTHARNNWDGNAAIANVLFDDVVRFEDCVPAFRVVEKENSECFVYMCSGGINGKTLRIRLPCFVLKMLDGIDECLVSLMPRVFALQMRVVLEKR
jgi:SAM-dependent methyltransferase